MLVYLDSVICVYAIDGQPPFRARAVNRLAALRAAGDRPAISDLTWLECRVRPTRRNQSLALADMEAFLTASDIARLPMATAVYERACRIQAFHNLKLADSLHLAAAIEGGCGLVLTNDFRWSRFPDIAVEILP